MKDFLLVNSRIDKFNNDVGINSKDNDYAYSNEVSMENNKKKVAKFMAIFLSGFLICMFILVTDKITDINYYSGGEYSSVHLANYEVVNTLSTKEQINARLQELDKEYCSIKDKNVSFPVDEDICVREELSGSRFTFFKIYCNYNSPRKVYLKDQNRNIEISECSIHTKYSGDNIKQIMICLYNKEKSLADEHKKILEYIGLSEDKINQIDSYIKGDVNNIDGIDIDIEDGYGFGQLVKTKLYVLTLKG